MTILSLLAGPLRRTFGRQSRAVRDHIFVERRRGTGQMRCSPRRSATIFQPWKQLWLPRWRAVSEPWRGFRSDVFNYARKEQCYDYPW